MPDFQVACKVSEKKLGAFLSAIHPHKVADLVIQPVMNGSRAEQKTSKKPGGSRDRVGLTGTETVIKGVKEGANTKEAVKQYLLGAGFDVNSRYTFIGTAIKRKQIKWDGKTETFLYIGGEA